MVAALHLKCFLIKARKILNSRSLLDSHRIRCLQNLVKEGLTRKIFRNKDLADSHCRASLATL
jgi:hypothetical protein